MRDDESRPGTIGDRRLRTLEKLLEIPSSNLKVALSRAADLVAAALGADKVDAFLYDPSRDTLCALGTSAQPLSAVQKSHGLDTLPVSNGGRIVMTFQSGATFASGALDSDPEELRGIRTILKIRSAINVPLHVGAKRRGVLSVTSQQPDYWNAEDVHFAEAVGAWVGTLAHQAELAEEIERNALVQGRRAAAEELVTVLAHDLRGYLQPVDLRLHLLERRAQGEDRGDDVRELALARRGIARVASLIGDILDVARIDQGVLAVEPSLVDLAELLNDLAASLTTPEQRIDVTVRENTVVPGDAARLRQCLQNVLSNALKYSPRSAPVAVFLSRVSGETRDCARIEVIDQGPGIAPEILPHIFERFVTGAGARKSGLGIGLYLAKQIARLHDGDLTVTTSATGTRFTLSLPCLAAAPP